MLDITVCFADRSADVLGPLPARLIDCTSNREPGDVDHLEAAFVERSHLVGRIEALENCFVHATSSLTRIVVRSCDDVLLNLAQRCHQNCGWRHVPAYAIESETRRTT